MDLEPSLKPGDVVGTYTIKKRIGIGGMGEVYSAWDPFLNRNVAIKILLPTALTEDETIERFKHEGRNLAQLKHPNVVNLYMLGEYDGRPFMAMEFVEGLTLDHFVMQNHCSLKQILDLFRQIVEGLGAAHQLKIVHRDIKPQNIMVDSKMQVRIVDFGIAKAHADVESPRTQQGLVIGTPAYMAPEVVAGRVALPQSDIYSLGLVLQFMLTGDVPTSLPKTATQMSRATSAKRLFEILPQEIRDLLLGMTQKTLELRYKTTDEILKDLMRVSLDGLHQDLLAEGSPSVQIQNIEHAYAQCRKQGFDMAEARLVVNLAARIDNRIQDDLGQTEKVAAQPFTLDDDLLQNAMERVRNAKTQVVAKRVTEFKPDIPEGRLERQYSLGTQLVAGFIFIAALAVGWRYQGQGLQAWFSAQFHSATRVPAPSPVPAPAPKVSIVKVPTPLPEATPAPKVPSINPPRPPDLKVGQTFKYKVDLFNPGSQTSLKSQIIDWEVVDIKNGQVEWQDGNGATEIRSLNPFLPDLKGSGSGFRTQGDNEIAEDPMQMFPLEAGKSWSTQVKNKSRNGLISRKLSCQTGAIENRITRAGQFQTFRVECQNVGSTTDIDVYYYSPKLNHWVEHESTYAVDGRSLKMRMELVGFTLPIPTRAPTSTAK